MFYKDNKNMYLKKNNTLTNFSAGVDKLTRITTLTDPVKARGCTTNIFVIHP